MRILGVELFTKQSEPKECSHKNTSYKYNSDNEDLYQCDSCGIVGEMTGGHQIPNSYNMITNSYAYADRTFTPLTLTTKKGHPR